MSVPNGVGTEKNRDIVVGGDEPRWFSLAFFRTKKGLIALGIAFALVMAGLLIYLFWAVNSSSSSSTTPKPQNVGIPVDVPNAPLEDVDVNYVQMADAELMNKVNVMIATRQFAEAEKLIMTQSDLNTNKTKLNLLLTIQQIQNKDAEAAQTNQKIESLGNLLPGEYIRLGDQSKETGDKAKAKDYYTKAIAAYNKEKQGNYESEIRRLQVKIEGLE